MWIYTCVCVITAIIDDNGGGGGGIGYKFQMKNRTTGIVDLILLRDVVSFPCSTDKGKDGAGVSSGSQGG